MTIKKFQGKTKEEAIEKAKAELGENAVVMNIKEIKPKGVFQSLKKSTYEVTAAMEEKENYVDSGLALKNAQKMHETINMTADEPIKIPLVKEEPMDQAKAEQSAIEFLKRNAELLKNESSQKTTDDSERTERIEEKLENLQSILEKQYSENQEKAKEEQEFMKAAGSKKNENLAFIKVLYETLIDNEVNEKYVNQIMDELEKVNWNGNSVDYILSNVYQKMILKFGTPHGIDLSGKKPKILFFVGPTGVGKTTTIAKVASKLKVEQGKKVAFLTADTYRIAAAEQLRTYANILDTPLNIIYSPEELNQAVEKLEDFDVILVDTAGFSHKNVEQKEDIRRLIKSVDVKYDSEVYLVLSATTKYKDLIEISDVYKEISNYKIIFTKLDETTTYGSILNIKLYSNAEVSYITNGQNVPDDIEVFNSQKIVKRLLGGR
ncbi:MAG: flagellar biosynthesis protein FlhF [Lachnospiraceae bacterium]|jgi:flagellar biosynthetic protein FlhF|uniref:flagellar biosynthesis protein FlhF n=1 Tax=Roseburia sp. 1XD42-69 TaxID=2320088 RepID=UPI000EA1DE3E|nr:flagellar biosynthesis protein FlhF [Roseburia sp. 1XD42-69]MCI8875179.1 flagellar biosynthesis protein FlhF [Lachnospiraceae bacterium]MCX4318578.1 flagellar biosynthesis protein FlhF [Lachnospiraceae bacterium]RKJ68309.1 flagellar biosynthesis protein FlhF [Roseburia sp. 1XD42-69]